MFVSYAQNFEDVMLWRALRTVEHGVYIDVGAQDPVVDSVSLAFFERGWRGIHVEPEPSYAAMLRRDRPGDLVVEAAIGSAGALVKFYAIPDTGISTLDPQIAEAHRARGWPVHETMTPCVPLAAIFSACEALEIHWLKIDIEGSEASAIATWGEDPRLPWIVVVESTLPLSQIESHAAWEPMLLRRGYEAAYFDGLNRYYVSPHHPELKAALSVPPNVFDKIAINGSASTTLHHLLASRHRAEIEAECARSTERLASVEADRAGLASANEKRVAEVRDLSLRLEALRGDLERQQRMTIEQTEALARAVMTLEAAGVAHAAAIGSLDDRHRVELEARLKREREIRQERDALLLGMRAREAAIHQQLDEAAAQIRSLRDEHDAQLRSMRAERDAQMRDMALLRRQFARSERKGSALHAELNKVRASWSWRLLHWRAVDGGPLPGADDDAGADTNREAPAGADLPHDAAPAAAPAPAPVTTPVPAAEVSSMSIHSTDPYVRAASVQELLLLHDVVFVNSAYWAVLGRQPDQGGRADYLGQLRAGTAKEEILVALARSDEGRRVAATLNGLDKVLAAYQPSRFSLPQRIMRRLLKGTSADLERNFRRLENLMVRHANAMTVRLDGMEMQLLKLSDEAAAGQRGLDAGRAAGHGAASSLPADRASVRTDDETPLGLQALTEQERFVLRKIAKL